MTITFLLLNILLALMWMFLWGYFNLFTLIAGLVVGWVLLGVISRALGGKNYAAKLIDLLSFFVYFIRIVIEANVQVARIVLKPHFNEASRIVRYPIAGMTDIQITSLANSITLTPGTISMDVSDDKQWLYVHCMFAPDRDEAIRGLDALRDRLAKEVF